MLLVRASRNFQRKLSLFGSIFLYDGEGILYEVFAFSSYSSKYMVVGFVAEVRRYAWKFFK